MPHLVLQLEALGCGGVLRINREEQPLCTGSEREGQGPESSSRKAVPRGDKAPVLPAT